MTFEGVWDGEALILTEDFRYAEGGEERRVWRIVPGSGGLYRATADDLVGVAEGTALGPRMQWRYRFNLALGQRRVRVKFDEWFEAAGPDLVINRARISKWGAPIGSTTIVFRKCAAEVAAGARGRALAA